MTTKLTADELKEIFEALTDSKEIGARKKEAPGYRDLASRIYDYWLKALKAEMREAAGIGEPAK